MIRLRHCRQLAQSAVLHCLNLSSPFLTAAPVVNFTSSSASVANGFGHPRRFKARTRLSRPVKSSVVCTICGACSAEVRGLPCEGKPCAAPMKTRSIRFTLSTAMIHSLRWWRGRSSKSGRAKAIPPKLRGSPSRLSASSKKPTVPGRVKPGWIAYSTRHHRRIGPTGCRPTARLGQPVTAGPGAAINLLSKHTSLSIPFVSFRHSSRWAGVFFASG
jgi:hypothetical protein